MKKLNSLKTIQLIVFVTLTMVCALVIFFNNDLFHIIANNPHVRIMCIMLWLCLGASFLFIFLDFNLITSVQHDYRELDYVVHSDPVANIANRYSSDMLIEKYLDKALPEDIGCIMIELSNIREINKLYGHLQGNALIRDFSNILKLTSINICFISRNGGNKFLALFENTNSDKINLFLTRVSQKVKANNASPSNYPIEYNYGIAFQEGPEVKTITDLIALSDRRLHNQ